MGTRSYVGDLLYGTRTKLHASYQERWKGLELPDLLLAWQTLSSIAAHCYCFFYLFLEGIFFFFKEIVFREIKISLGGSVFKTSSANTSIMSQNHDKRWKQGGKMGGLINMFHNWALGIHLFQNSCSSNIKSHQWPICQRFSGHIFEIKISSSDLTSPSVLTWVMG